MVTEALGDQVRGERTDLERTMKKLNRSESLQLTFQGCIDATTVDLCVCVCVCVCFTHPAAVFTPRRVSFIPVFALGCDGSDSDSGIDGFDTWLYNGLQNEEVHSNISCSVFGTQHPDVLLLCINMTDMLCVYIFCI